MTTKKNLNTGTIFRRERLLPVLIVHADARMKKKNTKRSLKMNLEGNCLSSCYKIRLDYFLTFARVINFIKNLKMTSQNSIKPSILKPIHLKS